MEVIKMEAQWGGTYTAVAEKARELAIEKKLTVGFEFNGVDNLVSSTTRLDLLWRDYCNAWLMEWKTVGPDCAENYSNEIVDVMKKRQEIRDEKEKQEQSELKKKDDQQKNTFAELTKGLEFEFSSEESWNIGISKNTDPYGSAIYEYAKSWALLMQARINKGETLKDIAEETSFQLGYLGITGFMYGAAVSVLASTWKHGEELRKWHNKEYGQEGEGVVNPAILTF